jgi:alanyl-tRNA synthetase
MTGDAARRHLAHESRRLHEIAGLLKAPVQEAPERVAALVEDRRKLERELAEARRKLAMGGGASADGGAEVRDVGGVKLMARAVSGIEMRDLKSLADEGKKRIGSGVVAIVGVAQDGKAGIVVGVTDDLTSRIDAVSLVRAGAEKLGGKGGGGRRDMAQAGGPDGAQAEAALRAVEAALTPA